MEQTHILIFMAILMSSSFILRKFLSRGKAKSIDLLKKLVPITLITGSLLWFMQKTDFNIAVYVFLAIVVYTSIYWFIMIYKKRDNGLRFFLWLGAVIPYIITPQFKGIISGMLLLLGATMSVTVFIYLYRHPYFNAEWLRVTLEEINQQVSRGKYSSKPVTAYYSVGKNFIASCPGLRIVAKKDKVILKMSRKLHKKLGSPNLEEFSYLLSRKIEEKQNNHDAKCATTKTAL